MSDIAEVPADIQAQSDRRVRARVGEPIVWLLATAASFSGDECLAWPFARDAYGYPALKAGRPTRILCELEHGAPPAKGYEAAHSCGRGSDGCVNPKHLRWATKTENMADKELHGTSPKGSRHGQSKLTEAVVIAIRESAKDLPQKTIAMMYGISESNVSMIVARKAWTHVQ